MKVHRDTHLGPRRTVVQGASWTVDESKQRVPDGQRKGSSLDNSFIPQLFICWGCCVLKVKPSTVKVRLERRRDREDPRVLGEGHRHYPESLAQPRRL